MVARHIIANEGKERQITNLTTNDVDFPNNTLVESRPVLSTDTWPESVLLLCIWPAKNCLPPSINIHSFIHSPHSFTHAFLFSRQMLFITRDSPVCSLWNFIHSKTTVESGDFSMSLSRLTFALVCLVGAIMALQSAHSTTRIGQKDPLRPKGPSRIQERNCSNANKVNGRRP